MSPTEKSIIEAALKLFSEKGYVATTIRDISNAANLTSASLYYYVDNKKDLLVRIMNNYLNHLISDAEMILSEIDVRNPEQKLVGLIKSHIQNHIEEQLASLVVDTEYRSLEEEDKNEIQALRKKYEKLWIDVLEEGADLKVFRFDDSKITAFALIGLCTGVAHWFREGHRYSMDDIVNQYIHLGMKMVKTD